MKNIIPVSLFLISLLPVIGCKESHKSDSNPAPAEVMELYSRYWVSNVTRCGDSAYQKTFGGGYVQVKNPTFYLVPESVSEVQKMNGTEMAYRFYMHGDFVRTLIYEGRWEEWKEEHRPMYEANFIKRNGIWYAGTNQFPPSEYQTANAFLSFGRGHRDVPTCDEVAAIRPKN